MTKLIPLRSILTFSQSENKNNYYYFMKLAKCCQFKLHEEIIMICSETKAKWNVYEEIRLGIRSVSIGKLHCTTMSQVASLTSSVQLISELYSVGFVKVNCVRNTV